MLFFFCVASFFSFWMIIGAGDLNLMSFRLTKFCVLSDDVVERDLFTPVWTLVCGVAVSNSIGKFRCSVGKFTCSVSIR